MKNVQGWIIGILAIVMVAGIFYIGYERGKSKELKKALDALEEKTQQEIAIKDEEIDKRDREILELNKRLVTVNERLDGLEQDRETWKEEARKWKEKAEVAPPETLIADIRGLLKTDEVWLVEDGVCFSMDAFRKVAEVVYDWNDFSLKREPNYIQTIENYKTKVYLLANSNGLLKGQIQDLKDIRALQKVWNEEMQEFIVKSSKGSFWSTVKTVGTGIAIGALGVLVFGSK